MRRGAVHLLTLEVGRCCTSVLNPPKHVLGADLPWLDNVVQAKAPKRLSVVRTTTEVRALLLQFPLATL